MHFDICKNIQLRHWKYENEKDPERIASKAAKILIDTIEELGDQLSKAFPPLKERDIWLKEVFAALKLLNRVIPSGQYIEITALNLADKKFKVNWADVTHPFIYENGENEKGRFFRSYADGLEGK